MYDFSKVIIGLIIFCGLITSPFWINLSAGIAVNKIDSVDKNIKTIRNKLKKEGKNNCIQDREYMKTNHMELLNNWRNNVIRNNIRFYNNNIEMGLSNTCMKCHSNKSEFCDQCHNYLCVSPYCWDCHVAPEDTKPIKNNLSNFNTNKINIGLPDIYKHKLKQSLPMNDSINN